MGQGVSLTVACFMPKIEMTVLVAMAKATWEGDSE